MERYRNRRKRVRGPAWLGIGAQRSGTSWFTDLLVQHPQVCLSRQGRKELHLLNDVLVTGLDEAGLEAYRSLFDGPPGSKPGEFTPFYLRGLWVPQVARQVCPPDVVLVVLLRDPVERFASALRHYTTRPDYPGPVSSPRLRVWSRDRGVDAQWGGMYASQLDAWRAVFDQDRIIVQQYEAVVRDAQAGVGRVWTALGLAPVPLSGVGRASWTTSDATAWTFDAVPELRGRLRALYEPEVRRLEHDWGLDRSLWPNFSGDAAG